MSIHPGSQPGGASHLRSWGSPGDSAFGLLPWTVGVVDKARTLELDKRVV